MFNTNHPEQNVLLAALSPPAMERLAPKLELVDLPLGKVLYEAGAKRYHAYFPTDSIITKLYATLDGGHSETSIVGNEGMVGVSLLMGAESAPGRAIVHRAGRAFRLSRQALKAELDRHEELQQLLLRYTQSMITQMAQTAVCNRHHSIEQQLCRWLLRFLDHLPDNQLVMTQELIANVLGVRREGVTEAAGKLRRRGIIKYHRGEITVLDRTRLERLSCECYAVVKRETDRLLPDVELRSARSSARQSQPEGVSDRPALLRAPPRDQPPAAWRPGRAPSRLRPSGQRRP